MRVAIVGHSQVPKELTVEKESVEVKIFRAPGGKIENFHTDSRLNGVLNYPHDLTVLWLGSNDITQHTEQADLTNRMIEVIHKIEHECGSTVVFVSIENREYPSDNGPVSNQSYRRLQRAINRKLPRIGYRKLLVDLPKQFHQAHDGIHMTPESQERVKQRIVELIEQYEENPRRWARK